MSFNNYVAKMRGRGVQKMSVFVHAQGKKTVHTRGGEGGQKMAMSNSRINFTKTFYFLYYCY